MKPFSCPSQMSTLSRGITTMSALSGLSRVKWSQRLLCGGQVNPPGNRGGERGFALPLHHMARLWGSHLPRHFPSVPWYNHLTHPCNMFSPPIRCRARLGQPFIFSGTSCCPLLGRNWKVGFHCWKVFDLLFSGLAPLSWSTPVFLRRSCLAHRQSMSKNVFLI